MQPLGSRRFRVALALALALVLALSLARKAWFSPRAPYLAQHAGAEWITFPSQPGVSIRRATEIPTTFRREFELESAPSRASLELRAHVVADLQVNGREVASLDDLRRDWKSSASFDVAPHLRPGRNEITVEVRTRTGPPALWLALALDESSLGTDASWLASCAGSAERPARLASTAMSEWAVPTAASAVGELHSASLNPSPWRALRARWSSVAFAVLAGLAIALALRRLRLEWTPLRLGLAVAALSTLHAALFWNNRALAPDQGFDALAHLEYVAHVQRTWSVPFADEGWEMYQPPLYYFLGAGLSQLAGAEPGSTDALHVLRFLGWLALAVQLAAIAATLWELLERDRRLVGWGLVLAACLPMQLYLFQYTTNEGLAASLISLAVLVAVRILRRGDTRWWMHFLLGLLLGAALLTKFSSLLALCGAVALLAAREGLQPVRSARRLARNAGLVLAVALVTCAPYYAAVFERFGAVLVWNLDEATGFAWWQDPGYRVAGDFFRFGESLQRPLLSSFASVPDALFSTLWNDGMLGGATRIDVRPPWDFTGLAALTAFSVLLSIALLAGLVLAFRRWLRDGELAWSLVFGLASVTLAALVSLTLDLPTFAQAKSIYASSVIVALAVAGALGLDAAARALGRWAPSLTAVLFAWAGLSVTSMWSTGEARSAGVDRAPSAAQVPSRADLLALHSGDAQAALSFARAEVSRAPDQAWAHRNLAHVLLRTGDRPAALAAAQEALARDPWNADVHSIASALHQLTGDGEASLRHLGWAHGLDPGQEPLALRLAEALRARGEVARARDVLERSLVALRRAPQADRARLESALKALAGG